MIMLLLLLEKINKINNYSGRRLLGWCCLITLCLSINNVISCVDRKDQTRPDPTAHHNSYKCSLQLAAHLVSSLQTAQT